MAGQVTSGRGADGSGAGEVFVGRLRESGRLAECAADARGGRARLAVIEGEAGIGKSSLARRFAASLPDFTILRAIGDPSETDLPGGVLGQLTRHVDRAVVQRHPLFSGPTAAGLSPHAVGGQLLLMLGALQETAGPVAVLVDDLQCADPFSAQVLGFVLRRLWADRVLTVLVARSEAESTGEQLDRLRSTMFVYLPHRSEEALAEHLRLIELLETGSKDEVETYARWHKLRTVEAYRAIHQANDKVLATRHPRPAAARPKSEPAVAPS